MRADAEMVAQKVWMIGETVHLVSFIRHVLEVLDSKHMWFRYREFGEMNFEHHHM